MLPNAGRTLFTLALKNLGIFSLSTSSPRPGSGLPVKIEIYCERMAFSASAAACVS